MSKRADPTNGAKRAAQVGGAKAGRRRTWWQRSKGLFRREPPAPRRDPLAENPNPPLRPRINLPYLAECTSCGKSERRARWMITGLSALLCDECVEARIRKALGRSPRTR